MSNYKQGISASEELPHVSIDEYAFFVSNQSPSVHDPKTGIQSTFANWKNRSANMKICKVISIEKIGLNDFLKTFRNVFTHCECVYAPENALSIEKVNEKLIFVAESNKSEAQKLKEKSDKQEKELRELKAQMAELLNEKKEEKKQRGRPSNKN